MAGDCAEQARGAAAFLHPALAGVDAPEEPPTPHVDAFLDRAERSVGAVELGFAPTLPGVLDACVAAEFVARRHAPIARTTGSLDRVARWALPTCGARVRARKEGAPLPRVPRDTVGHDPAG